GAPHPAVSPSELPVTSIAKVRTAAPALTTMALLSLRVVHVAVPTKNAVSAPALSARPRLTQLSVPATNIARGRRYTLAPRPNYPLTSDGGDEVQLTDGAYSVGTPLWTRATIVGWVNAAPVTIVIDLGSIQPIAGVSFSTAAGTAGVLWPRSIFVMVSDDGRRFFSAGDLAALPGKADPPSAGYAAFRFVTGDLTTHGRYVTVIVDPTGPFTFCDEIEVFAGDPAWLGSTLTADSTTDLQKFFVEAHMRLSIQRRLSADLEKARAALEASQVSAAVRAFSEHELDIAGSQIGAVPLQPAAAAGGPSTGRTKSHGLTTHVRFLQSGAASQCRARQDSCRPRTVEAGERIAL